MRAAGLSTEPSAIRCGNSITMDNPRTPRQTIHRGLAGIIFDETRITDIDGQRGELRYRGYDIEQLAVTPSFEKVAYLLLHDCWPSYDQSHAFQADLAARRSLPEETNDLLYQLGSCHPDDALRTSLSSLDLGQRDGREPLEIGLDLIAKVPSLVATHHAIRKRQTPLPPDPSLDQASDFLKRLIGRVPNTIEREAINLDFVLHADHGANASTFAGRVVTSTAADMVAAATGAVSAFAGPLHGGAISAASAMLATISSPEDVPDLVSERRRKKLPIFGFGHRVYRTCDPRSHPYRKAVLALADHVGDKRCMAILDALIEAMAPFRRMGIDINVDLYATAIYRLLGVPDIMATNTFVAARIAGWVAQILEQQENNILIRPRLRYAGNLARDLS